MIEIGILLGMSLRLSVAPPSSDHQELRRHLDMVGLFPQMLLVSLCAIYLLVHRILKGPDRNSLHL